MVFCNLLIGSYSQKALKCHNPYFNRWFSAIRAVIFVNHKNKCHNPYFNRWFSAIFVLNDKFKYELKSQSLF